MNIIDVYVIEFRHLNYRDLNNRIIDGMDNELTNGIDDRCAKSSKVRSVKGCYLLGHYLKIEIEYKSNKNIFNHPSSSRSFCTTVPRSCSFRGTSGTNAK